MNQVATRSSTAVAALQGLKKGIANVKATLVKKGGDPFLRVLKSGEWVYGQEDTEVEAGSAWAINPLSITHGWVAWKRGEGVDNSSGPVAEVMVSASQPLPLQSDLPDISSEKQAQWGQQFAFSMVCLTGEDKGEQVLFKTNSVGGIAMVDTILNAISTQLDEDPENPVPVVVLDSDSYKHKKHGHVVTPIMDIKTWRPLSEDLPDVQAELDKQEAEQPAPEPAPAAKRTRKTSSVPATGKASTVAADEDDELAAMEAEIARRKAAKDAANSSKAGLGDAIEDEKAKRRAELVAQLEAMGDDNPDGESKVGGAAAPMRRRRNA
jgi:hypothetical protein